jgi:hypothetical protein
LCRARVMVFNATFNNISVILWWTVLLVVENYIPHTSDIMKVVIIDNTIEHYTTIKWHMLKITNEEE